MNTLWTATTQISSSINGTQPISCLPPEILAEVFGCYQHLETAERRKWYTWIRFMLVSRGWRSTILSFPSLWSRVYITNEISPEIILLFLQRSGGHPLDVIIPQMMHPLTLKSNQRSQALEAVSAHASRIRSFVLGDSGEHDTDLLLRIFSQPAPNLTHLNLWTPRPAGSMPFPKFFGLEFPKLRKLEIKGVGAWPNIVGANLTRITISNTFTSYILSRCIPYSPNLKVLKLLRIWKIRRTDLSAGQRIALPPGVRLTIKDSPRCPRILELFSLSQDCHLKIGHPMKLTGNGTPPLSCVLPDDLSPFQNLRTLVRLHITARFSNKPGLKLKWCGLDRPTLGVNVEFFKNPRILERNGNTIMGFLGDLRPIVLGGVEELRMEGFVGPLGPQAIELLKFLEGMPALTRLTTADDNEDVFRSVLNDLGCRAVVVRAGA